MKFEIGQEVVCIKSHSLGYVTKGKTYIIKNILKRRCKCEHPILDVGIIRLAAANTKCSRCGASHILPFSNIAYVSSRLFIPIQKDSWREVTFEEIKEPTFLCAN